jgi:hypothetical protein
MSNFVQGGQNFQKRDEDFKQKQKEDFDRRHRVQPLHPLPEDTDVWIKTDAETVPG